MRDIGDDRGGRDDRDDDRGGPGNAGRPPSSPRRIGTDDRDVPYFCRDGRDEEDKATPGSLLVDGLPCLAEDLIEGMLGRADDVVGDP